MNELRYNLILDQIVKELSVWCRYKSNGCLQSISLINKKNHEKQCKFGPTKCIHASKGCKFSGTNDELEKHLTICPYELLKPFIHKMEESISSLKAQIEVNVS